MNQEFWKQFERTGLVDDYLQYIACTREDGLGMLAACGELEYGAKGGRDTVGSYSDGDGIISHAYRGI